MKFEKQYRKIAITKAYDLLELKANGRIDAEGDYLDDNGNKLTYHGYQDEDGVLYPKQELQGMFTDEEQKELVFKGIFVETLENKSGLTVSVNFESAYKSYKPYKL